MGKLSGEELTLREREVELETKELNLEVLRDQVKKLRERQAAQRMSHQQVEDAIQDFREQQERGYDGCNHKKGGKNLEGARGRGLDDKYAIIRHQLPVGDLAIICTKCRKMWLPSALALRMGVEPDAEGYKIACGWPTDNEDSGSSLFVVVRGAAPNSGTGAAPARG